MRHTDRHAHRLSDVRFIGSLNGRYTLSSRKSDGSRVQVFACRVQSISPRMAVVTAPVRGSQGEVVTAHFENLGIIRATISRGIDYGFAMDIEASEEERIRLGGRIDWIKKHVHDAVPDMREHKRFLPRDPRASLILADGTVMECFIINLSRSGVAVSADIAPAIGTPLAVGKVVGRVIRHLEVGFAVRFLQIQDGEAIEQLLKAEPPPLEQVPGEPVYL